MNTKWIAHFISMTVAFLAVSILWSSESPQTITCDKSVAPIRTVQGGEEVVDFLFATSDVWNRWALEAELGLVSSRP